MYKWTPIMSTVMEIGYDNVESQTNIAALYHQGDVVADLGADLFQ
ncbi:hypothetical protein [Escherichia coli]